MVIESSYNFRRIDPRVTTSGFVAPDGLKHLASQGYEVLINLMPDDSGYAVPHERRIVMSQNLEYIYIPVDFKAPEVVEFDEFSAAVDRLVDQNRVVHIHCAANYRVSAFYGRYAVSRGIWSVDRAWRFIHDLWEPKEYPGWFEFIDNGFAGSNA